MSEYPRKVTIEDPKLVEWINKKADLMKELIKASDRVTEAEKEANKIAMQVQKFKDKIILRTNQIAKPHLTDDFEELEKIDIEGGELNLTIINHLEEWKKSYLAQRKEAEQPEEQPTGPIVSVI